ncbi:MAG: hypothetical protein FD149_729 [Rhodospirillaceae bacterium]|nr:MAG: hypothetical protein FD149_729 [Rhodospirillaceae bacterium]
MTLIDDQHGVGQKSIDAQDGDGCGVNALDMGQVDDAGGGQRWRKAQRVIQIIALDRMHQQADTLPPPNGRSRLGFPRYAPLA